MHPLLLYPLLVALVYTLLTLTLYALSALSLIPAASFPARILASYASLLLCATYGVLISLLLRATGQHRLAQHLTALAFHHTMRLTTGLSFAITSGAQHLTSRRPCVIVGNHQSELDVLFLARIFPPYCSVTAKSSLRHAPFLGWFMALSGTVFIDRADRSSARQAFAGAVDEMLTRRQSVFIFPEGTRSYATGPRMGAFKKGAFHLAVQAQVDVVPVVAANYWGVLAAREGRFRAGKIPVRVLEPVSTKGLGAGDVDALAGRVRESMLVALAELGETEMGKAVGRK
ncbi:MAG: hypothetical protein LQ348_004009 [Seirophora lacunosa]|nr:MAG: hypothetical protein LQ348_004009 [Seirophora lacunosa]